MTGQTREAKDSKTQGQELDLVRFHTVVECSVQKNFYRPDNPKPTYYRCGRHRSESNKDLPKVVQPISGNAEP